MNLIFIKNYLFKNINIKKINKIQLYKKYIIYQFS